jgi:hypothetical protein
MKLGILGCDVDKNARSDISVVLRMFATAWKLGAFAMRGRVD